MVQQERRRPLVVLPFDAERMRSHHVASELPNPVPMALVMARLREAVMGSHHEFWPDDVCLLDERVVDATRIHGPRRITDLYLLALAVRHDGTFVTFDGSIAIKAVHGAVKRHLTTL
jgi:predicted nucleic acid-binding protein